MSNYCVGTMSTLGFIMDDPYMAMDRHITYWFAARKNQCKNIPDVPSFEYLLKEYQGNKETMASEVSSSLKSYFMLLFDTVEVEVNPVDYTNDISKYTLEVAVRCYYNATYYDLQKAVLISGSSYKLIKEGRNV